MANDQATYDYTTDPEFLKAPPEQQHAYLSQVDPDYAKGTPEQQQAYRGHLSQHVPTEAEAAANPPKAPNTVNVHNAEFDMPEDLKNKPILASPVMPGGTPSGITPLRAAIRAGAGLMGGYGASKVAPAITKNPYLRDAITIGGGLLGEGAAGAAEGVAGRMGFTPKSEVSTPIGTFKYNREQPSLGGGAPEPSRGEFEAQQEAQLTKEGKLAKIPAKMPKPATTPEDIANRSIAVGKAKSQIVSGRPFEQLNEQEQAEALMRRGREQQQIEAGAPVEGSNQRPVTIPEPHPVQEGERPGAQWSVKRRSDLIQNAKRGQPGAGTVLNQLNKPVIYEPRGVVGTNPREVTTFGEGGEPGGGTTGGGTVGKGPIKGGKASLEGMGKGEQARAQLHAQLEKDTGVNVHDFVDKFMEKNPKATRGQAYDIAEETLRDLSGGKYVNEIERQMSQERLNRIMGPEQRGPQRLGPEHRGTK